MSRVIIVGISGASGAFIAIETLNALRDHDAEIHLVISKSAEQTISSECDMSVKDIAAMADHVYDIENIGALIASGSFKSNGMIIVPCSMKTVSAISTGYSDNLLLRAADVMLKERRKLVLVTREAPLSFIHLRNMAELSKAGAVIMPPMLSFYSKPKTVKDMVDNIVGKILDQFDIEHEGFQRWKG